MDMSGGAATIAAMAAIAQLNPKVNVIGVVPAVENMPSDRAIRPGDVLTAMNGKTVEVVNTDAEGRLILGDAVVHAQRLGAKRIVDAATLTGAVIIALGNLNSAVLGGPQEWVDQVIASGRKAGDRLWQLPMDEGVRRTAQEPDSGYVERRRPGRRGHHRRLFHQELHRRRRIMGAFGHRRHRLDGGGVAILGQRRDRRTDQELRTASAGLGRLDWGSIHRRNN